MCALTDESSMNGTRKRILIIEDEDSIRRLASRFLEVLGYDPIVAATAEEAIELMKKDNGEVIAIISDIMMPDIDGRNLVAQIREQHPEIKALYMSGYGAEDINMGEALGPNEAFTPKPFTSESLGEALSNLLAK